MALILIIADVHMKPRMFDEAHKILEKGLADKAVFLGDLVDDWGEEYNVALYYRTMDKAIEFQKAHPDTVWCMGNHDYPYWHPEFGHRESGHSKIAEIDMKELLDELYRWDMRPEIIAQIDNCIFSHAGVNGNWVERHLAAPLASVGEPVLEAGGEALWEEDSPLWWRPQPEYDGDPDEAWEKDKYLQVVGHSPMECPTQQGSILSCDVFSTYRNGTPYGDQKWVVVDTETKEWEAKSLEDWLE